MDSSSNLSSSAEERRRLRWAARLRVALLLVAAAALVAAVAPSLRPSAPGSGAVYACPMHPQVTAAEPGRCPICGMALVPIRGGSSRAPIDPDAMRNLLPHAPFDIARTRALQFNLQELRGAAWVDDDATISAVFYDDQLAAIPPGSPAVFSPTRDPETRATVHRTADAPVSVDGSTSRIRFEAAAPLPPGHAGWVELERAPRTVLGVPAAAILESPEGPYVIVPALDGTFQRKPVRLGETFAGAGVAVVLSGVRSREPVVSRASFFVDAERKLDAADGGMAAAGAAHGPMSAEGAMKP